MKYLTEMDILRNRISVAKTKELVLLTQITELKRQMSELENAVYMLDERLNEVRNNDEAVNVKHTCQRRARKATHMIYTGHNDKEIAEFTMLRVSTHNKCLLLRSSDGTLMGAMRVGGVALFGQDNRLQLLTSEDFESKYELLTD